MARISFLPRLATTVLATAPLPAARHLHSSHSLLAALPKPPMALISKIRSLRPGTPLTLARSALVASENDLDGALKWIADQAASSGAAKAERLKGREAKEGLVGVAMLGDGMGGVGVRAAMVELSCETDFVARTDEFRDLLESIARSLAFFAEPSFSITSPTHITTHTPASIADIPILPPPSASVPTKPLTEGPLPTIATSIATTISRLGENISLRRAVSLAVEPALRRTDLHLASTYLHGSKTSANNDTSFQSGTLASLLVFKLPPGGEVEKPALQAFARAIARQVVAVPTTSVRKSGEVKTEEEHSTVLYEQPLITLSSSDKLEFEQGSLVGEVLKKWSAKAGVDGEGLEVVEVRRWEVGGEEVE
ncbi:elongation factor Ts, partial [Phenoliferia sp. Uapishka_3]